MFSTIYLAIQVCYSLQLFLKRKVDYFAKLTLLLSEVYFWCHLLPT